MEKCARTRFFIPSEFWKGFWRWKKVAEQAIHTPSDSPKAPARWKQVPARPRHSIKAPARWNQVPARPYPLAQSPSTMEPSAIQPPKPLAPPIAPPPTFKSPHGISPSQRLRIAPSSLRRAYLKGGNVNLVKH